ncbi:hypothetical protein GGR28_000077 [Lewinella aquimaris]|uniref:HTH LytTR-type domain-containing protein n=1 Tax=Neolewinella aquimaris TaxID=1835722 RepID=A0A840E8U1_9BACT|nr:LytTR family DNA-binding domain-containing protein [Neolewinella aquimaris]MBB4077476.1 hypothetical protein [Neolewinella aquimaris]
MTTLLIRPTTPREWKGLFVLYLSCCFVYYLTTWQAYGGFSGGHPPLLNLEEFVASAGLKFAVFLCLSLLLFRLLPRADDPTSGIYFWVQPLIGLVLFVLLSDCLQTVLLDRFKWVHFFGGRLYVFNYLIAGGFYALQCSFLAALKFSGRETQELRTQQEAKRPETPWILVRKGKTEVPLVRGDIQYLKACGNYCRLRANDQSYLLSMGIGAAEQRFPDLPFLRIHRSYLINLNQVVRIAKVGRKHQVELEDGTILPVGAKYLPTLSALRD